MVYEFPTTQEYDFGGMTPPPDCEKMHTPQGSEHSNPVMCPSGCNIIRGMLAGSTHASPAITNSPLSSRPCPALTISACSRPSPPREKGECLRKPSIAKYGQRTSSVCPS